MPVFVAVGKEASYVSVNTFPPEPPDVFRLESEVPPPAVPLAPVAVTSTPLHAPLGPVLLCIELCAGSAGLSAELTGMDFEAVPVDYERNQQVVRAVTVKADLSSETGQTMIRQIMQSPRFHFLHAAPPCGTCSRARSIPIPLAQRLRGAPAPVPLRSDAFPAGLPDLSGFLFNV